MQSRVDFIEYRFGGWKSFGEDFAHANGLAALAGKYECCCQVSLPDFGPASRKAGDKSSPPERSHEFEMR